MNELARQDESLADLKPIPIRLDGYPKTGLKADKAFYDSLEEGQSIQS